MKKISVTICAVFVSAVLAGASVFAAADSARPQPGTDAASGYTTSAGDQAVTDTTAGSAAPNTAANNVTAAASQQSNANKKYQSKLGGFLWFLLSVIVNFVISCWVGNRFYNLAKRNAQGSSEIRALRKDIEEKFASTLRDISEPAVEVINQNESYARTDEGLAMPEKRGHIELSEEEREMMRRWDEKRAAQKPAREPEEDDEDDEYYDDEPRSERYSSRAYQPTRRSSGIEFEDDEDYEDEYEDDDEYEEYEDRARAQRRPARMSGAAAKNVVKKSSGKAKKLLSNVFPFDE